MKRFLRALYSYASFQLVLTSKILITSFPLFAATNDLFKDHTTQAFCQEALANLQLVSENTLKKKWSHLSKNRDREFLRNPTAPGKIPSELKTLLGEDTIKSHENLFSQLFWTQSMEHSGRGLLSNGEPIDEGTKIASYTGSALFTGPNGQIRISINIKDRTAANHNWVPTLGVHLTIINKAEEGAKNLKDIEPTDLAKWMGQLSKKHQVPLDLRLPNSPKSTNNYAKLYISKDPKDLGLKTNMNLPNNATYLRIRNLFSSNPRSYNFLSEIFNDISGISNPIATPSTNLDSGTLSLLKQLRSLASEEHPWRGGDDLDFHTPEDFFFDSGIQNAVLPSDIKKKKNKGKSNPNKKDWN
jgi:hypothetical protein